MAGTLAIYSLIYVSIDNAVLTQEGRVTLRRMANSQAVHTVPLGYAGESPGSEMAEGDIESAVPIAAIEYDPGKVIQGLIPVEIGVLIGTKVAKVKGFIIEDDYAHGVNQEAKQVMRYRGRFPTIE